MTRGKLNLVSLGPGALDLIPPMAERALRESDAIVGYELYLKPIAPWIAGKEIHSPPLTQERERALKAIEFARAGRTVSLVSSGDIGVYAMAALAFELMREDDPFDVQIIPGITAANSCAALLGSPLSHDFATLSLSDLLCPWEWIEERARHLAQADFVTVLYNVQSRARQDGVYRVLEIFREHKRSETWCGVVRNAFRDEQSVEIRTLAELARQRFDMLTTLVIGNRFTQRKGRFLFTPRGYGGWSDSAKSIKNQQLTISNSVWVFSGTGDGNALASEVAARGHRVVISTASEYGAEVAREKCAADVTVRAGRMGVEARRRELSESGARAIVDATHPFAAEISRQLIALSRELEIPYLRYERPGSNGEFPAIRFENVDAAAAEAIQRGTRIFLATGTKTLDAFLRAEGAKEREWFARVTPEPEHVRRALDAGIARERLCSMQGPFSQALNEALWCAWQIDCVVTKDSGDAGGCRAKAAAAHALGIPLIVIERPKVDYPCSFSDFSSLLERLDVIRPKLQV